MVGPQFGLDRIYSFGDIVIFIFCRFGLRLPIHAHFCGVLGHISPNDIMTSNDVTHRPNPKGTSLRGNTSFEPESVKIGSAVRPGRVPEKKGQDRTGQSNKKSQSVNISPIWGEAPTVPINTKICVVGSLPDVIMYAKFQAEIF